MAGVFGIFSLRTCLRSVLIRLVGWISALQQIFFYTEITSVVAVCMRFVTMCFFCLFFF